MWSDNETTLDLLGFKVHANLVRSVVTDINLLPITIGVFGDWGGGKTSVMKMLQRDITPENYPVNSQERPKYEKVVSLYFNGWLFEGYDDAKSALLSSVLLQLGKNERVGPKIRHQVASLLESVDWMRLARLGFKEIALPAALAYMTGGVSLLPTIAIAAKALFEIDQKKDEGSVDASTKQINWEDILKSDKKPSGPMDVRTFRDRFSQMLKDSDIESLVIFIDDLDRCSPERIVENLEAIKLFLSVDRTAFVIGADPRIIRYAIARIYSSNSGQIDAGNEQAQTDIVTDYLEKVIQVPYQLPRLSPAEVETYMAMLFCQQLLEKTEFDRLHQALESHRQRDMYSVFGYGAIEATLGSLPPELSSSLTFCALTAPLITEGLKGNPRQVKRFLNAFILRKKLAEIAKLTHIKDATLVKLMVLEYVRPDQFNQLFNWQSTQDGLPVEIQLLEKVLCPPDGDMHNEKGAKEVHPDWATTFTRKWIAMEPYLAKEDLRDYFWIARDRMQSTLSGVSLIPPLIRQILEDLLSGNAGKRNQALKSIGQLQADETTILIHSLIKHIKRYPNDKNGFDGLRLMAEDNVAGSIDALVEALSTCPSDQIPPAVGTDVQLLLRSKPDLKPQLDPVLAKLKTTNTMIGAALKPRKGEK